MALPDSLKYSQGTAKSWKSSGGDYAITLTSLANDAGRQGVKGDLGALRAALWEVLVTSSVGSAATNGRELEVYWAASTSATAATDNPGNTSGSDASLSNPDEVKNQLLFIGSLVFSNAVGTAVQRQRLIFSPPARYGMPVFVNKTGQTLGSTAGDHEFRATPIEQSVED